MKLIPNLIHKENLYNNSNSLSAVLIDTNKFLPEFRILCQGSRLDLFCTDKDKFIKDIILELYVEDSLGQCTLLLDKSQEFMDLYSGGNYVNFMRSIVLDAEVSILQNVDIIINPSFREASNTSKAFKDFMEIEHKEMTDNVMSAYLCDKLSNSRFLALMERYGRMLVKARSYNTDILFVISELTESTYDLCILADIIGSNIKNYNARKYYNVNLMDPIVFSFLLNFINDNLKDDKYKF